MKKVKINYPFLIVTLLAAVYLFKTCVDNDKKIDQQAEIMETIDTIYQVDTIKRTITSEPEIIYEYISLPTIPIDTPNVIKGYFSKRFYSDTIQDSCLFIIINDTVFKNSIISRSLDYEQYENTIYITKEKTIIIPPLKKYISIGASVYTNFSFSSIVYYTVDKNTFGIGYDPINKHFSINYLRKIKWRKR